MQNNNGNGNNKTPKILWETTQMKIALSVVWASLFVSIILAISGKLLGTEETQLAAIIFLFGVANLVTGFYFGRTNHQKDEDQNVGNNGSQSS